MIGTVNLHVDYKIPFDSVRAELTTDRTVVLRALVSASNAGKCWELRCQVRERLLEFLRTRHPDCLPRIRAELDSPGTDRASDGDRLDVPKPRPLVPADMPNR